MRGLIYLNPLTFDYIYSLTGRGGNRSMSSLVDVCLVIMYAIIFRAEPIRGNL